MHIILYMIHCTVQCSLCNTQYTVHNTPHCSLCTVQYTYCTQYTSLFTVQYEIHIILYKLHCSLFTLTWMLTDHNKPTTITNNVSTLQSAKSVDVLYLLFSDTAKWRNFSPCKSCKLVNSGKLWMFALWSDTFGKCSINTWCAVYSVQCVLWSASI